MPKTDGYHIYVEFEKEKDDSPVAGQSTKKTYGEKTSQSLEKGIKSLVSFGAIKNTAQQLIGHEVNTIELKTGAQEYEQRQQFIFENINKGVSAAATIGIGAATGNLPLALIGVFSSLLTKGISILQNMHSINLKRQIEDVGIRMQNVRAGTGGRRENNR